jgi:hypothetical protein
MFSHGLTLYLRISADICWAFNYNLGEPNHFVHDGNPKYPDGTPLNKDYSVELMFLWFYITISYNVPLPYIEQQEALDELSKLGQEIEND